MNSETNPSANSNYNPGDNTLRRQVNRKVPDPLTDDRRVQPQNASRKNKSQSSFTSTRNNGGFGVRSCCRCLKCRCPCHKRAPVTSTAAEVTKVTDQQLITDYLLKKINNQVLPENKISDVDIYINHPERLVENQLQEEDGNWYFFSARNKKYASSSRIRRKADSGYWKISGIGTQIRDRNGGVIGHKNYLVYYELKGSQEKTKTDWIMHEYVVTDLQEQTAEQTSGDECMKICDYGLYKIYKKTGENAIESEQVINLALNDDEEDEIEIPSIFDQIQDPNASSHEQVQIPIDHDALLPPMQHPGSIDMQEINPITLQFQNNSTLQSPLNYGVQSPLMLQNDLTRYAFPVVSHPVPPLIPVYTPAPASVQTYSGGNLVLWPESCYIYPTVEFNSPGPSYNPQGTQIEIASPPSPYNVSPNQNSSGITEVPQDFIWGLLENEKDEGWHGE